MDALIAVLRLICGLSAIGLLACLLWSILRAAGRPAGAGVGSRIDWLRSPLFYAAASVFFFGMCFLLWIPLPGAPFPETAAILGALLCLPGLALWGRVALGAMYFVSTGFGAELFAGHRLIAHGPYRFVRHPMYAGLMLAAAGGLLLYQTWTAAFLLVCALATIRRARREEEALATTFGAEWAAYCARVPMLIPSCFHQKITQ